MPRMNALSNYATTIAAEEGCTRITYHSTVIVEYDAETIILRTGGWDSVTTRRKMNQAANQFGLDYGVYRDKGESYVRVPAGWFVAGKAGEATHYGPCEVPLDRVVTVTKKA